MILALVYGYVPYLILPLFAALDRIDQRHDRGGARPRRPPGERVPARRRARFAHRGRSAAIVLIALPMFGDYYTPDLMSGSPRTSMIGNVINDSTAAGPEQAAGPRR